MSSPVLTTVEIQSLPLIARGKVRDLHEVDDSTLLFTTTDRISAYDVVMTNGVPLKGAVLTQLSAHWFSVLRQQIPGLRTHFLTLDPPERLTPAEKSQIRGRSMQVRKFKVFPIEAIVRELRSAARYLKEVTMTVLTVH